jgi:putative lipoic acid-binding regulatory protein
MAMAGKEPRIEYPCRWTYTLIGMEETVLRACARFVLGDRKYEVQFSHKSPAGKYVSLHVHTEVDNEEDRLGLFDSFSKEPGVKFVL